MLWLVAPGGCVEGATCRVWLDEERVSKYLERKGWGIDPKCLAFMKRASDDCEQMVPLPELYNPGAHKATNPAGLEGTPERFDDEHGTENADVKEALRAYRDEIVLRMRSEGFTHRQIGLAFGVTDRTSKNWVADMRKAP